MSSIHLIFTTKMTFQQLCNYACSDSILYLLYKTWYAWGCVKINIVWIISMMQMVAAIYLFTLLKSMKQIKGHMCKDYTLQNQYILTHYLILFVDAWTSNAAFKWIYTRQKVHNQCTVLESGEEHATYLLGFWKLPKQVHAAFVVWEDESQTLQLRLPS